MTTMTITLPNSLHCRGLEDCGEHPLFVQMGALYLGWDLPTFFAVWGGCAEI